jgi:hypothetical protein
VKLAVIVSDFGAAANIGGNVETKVRTFELPAEVVAYIKREKHANSTVTLAVTDEESQP